MNKLHNVLYIDLSTKSKKIVSRPDLFEKYLGGTGVASQLLLEECPKGTDALSAENPIIFAIGPLTAIYPLASKTVAMYKSPHTGNLGESHAGGRSAISIRMAGYGAIVIKGKSDIPIYLSIKKGNVQFKNATTIWGMSSSYTAGAIIRENEVGSGHRTIMRIGQAGENMVTYASVTTETYRHFGRTGLGALFGYKMLKGICIIGSSDIEVEDTKLFKKTYKDIYKEAVNSDIMRKYHELGTAINIQKLHDSKALPTKNLTVQSLDDISEITGENIAEKFLSRRIACAHCPVACIHLARLREEYVDEPYFYKSTPVCYDFELIYSLGSMVGIDKTDDLLKLIDIVEDYGVDAMSMGVVLAWITEMYSKNKIGEKELGDIQPEWGNSDIYIQLVKNISYSKNDFYKATARGVSYASSIYGGEDFALSFGKNEMPGYHTGPAAYIGYIIGARHSHLDNAGYSVDQKQMLAGEVKPSDLIDMLVKEESFRQILSSLTVCFFARGIYSPEKILTTLKSTGIHLTEEQLLKMGEDIYKAKYQFKKDNGFSFSSMHIPERIYETPEPTNKLKKEYIEEALVYAEGKLI